MLAPNHPQRANVAGYAAHVQVPGTPRALEAQGPVGPGSAPEATPHIRWPVGREPWPSPPGWGSCRVTAEHDGPTRAAPCLTCIFMPSRPSLGKNRARSGSEGRAGARRHPGGARGQLLTQHRVARRLPPRHSSRLPRCPCPQGLLDGPRSSPAHSWASQFLQGDQSLHFVVAPSTERLSQASTRHRAPHQRMTHRRRRAVALAQPHARLRQAGGHPPGPSPEVIGNPGHVLLQRAGGRPVQVPAHEHVDGLRDLRGQAGQRRVARRAGAGALADTGGPSSPLLSPSLLEPDRPQSGPRKPRLRERPEGAQGVHTG